MRKWSYHCAVEFFIGAKKADWLEKTAVPLFLTYAVLSERKSLPRARGLWALDPNGFEMLRLHGGYTFSAEVYARDVVRYQAEIGNLAFASSMDWMCEEAILKGGRLGRLRFVGTKLSVREHQRRTIDSYLELCSLAPGVPWMPVLQGAGSPDYYWMLDEYARRGVDLSAAPRVGVGSICRRQATLSAAFLIGELLGLAPTLKIHAFGFKTAGVASVIAYVIQLQNVLGRDPREVLGRFSCDSMSWSMGYRFDDDPGLRHLKNKLEGALAWRERFVEPYVAMGIMEGPPLAA